MKLKSFNFLLFLFFFVPPSVFKHLHTDAFLVTANQKKHNNNLKNRGITDITINHQPKKTRLIRCYPLAANFLDSKALTNLYYKYIDWLDRSPFVARSVTAAVVGCLGDLLSQRLEAFMRNDVFLINWTRFSSFFISGLLYVGPFLQYWYGGLWAVGRWMERKVTKKKIWQTLAQVFVDQTLGVLIFFPLYFYAYEASEAIVSFQAPVWATATKKLNQELKNVFITQYKVWPIWNTINFGVVPEHLRVLFSNIFSVFWNAYLCTRISRVH